MLAALFVLRERRPRAGAFAAVAGLAAALGLFVGFTLFGVEADDTVALDLGFSLIREEAVLVTLPISAVAFAVGYALDRSKHA
jgi:hypothetical protein